MVGAAKVVVCPLSVLRGPNIMSSLTWGPGHFRLQGLSIFPYLLPSTYLFFPTPSTLTFVQPYLSYFNYFYFHLFVSFS